MLGGFGSSTSAGLASGGTVDGDLVITGDFKVEGAGSFAYDEIIQGTIGATRVNIGTRDASGNPPTDNASYMLQIEKYGGTANIKLSRTGNASSEWSNIHNEATIGTITEHPFVLQTHSTDRLTITSAGLVGIGGTPSHPLHINSSVANGQLMRLHNTNNGDGTFIKFTGAHSTSEDWQIGSGTLGYYIYNLTDSSMGLMVSNAGNVGIGTTSPNTNLEVVGTIRASGATPAIQLKETDTTNAIQGFQINSSGGSISFNSLNNNDGFTSTDYQMHRTGSGAYYHKWFIANSSKMILNNSGNLGIGTDSPTLSKLQINTSSSTRGLVINATDSNASYMQFSNSTTGTSTSQGLQIGLQVDESAFIDLKYSSHLAIATAGTERMRITSSGNIGIGTTSPSDYSSVANKLVVADSGNSGITVASGTTSYGALYFADGTSGSAEYMGAMEYNHNGNVMRIFANGAVGIQLDSNSRISLSNNDSGDNSNTVFGALSGTSLASGGIYNVLVGANTGASISTGDKNVALGTSSLRYGTGSNNIAIGYLAHYGSGSGSNNVSIGSESARALTSGANNVAVGFKSLYSISTASANVAIGKETLYSTTTGGSNTALGHQAMYYGTESDSNVAVGQSALEKNVTGDDNTAIGYQSQYGVSGQSHSNNTSVGYQSLLSITTGGNNTSVGYQSAYSLTTGQQNVHIGSNAGINATGDFNSFVGYNAGRGASGSATGVYNVALGREALRKYTSGQKNIAIGGLALYEATSGSSNVAVGDNALRNNTTASNNVALGVSALQALTTGAENIAIGSGAGDSITTDSRVVAIGYEAYASNDTTNAHDNSSASARGSGNTAIGYKSMTNLNQQNFLRNTAVGFETMSVGTTYAPKDNVALGYKALRAISSGTNNSAIGSQSLLSLTTGDDNVTVGYKSLYAVTTGARNVGLGVSAGQAITSGTENIAIGKSALLALTTGNSNVAIGQSTMSSADGGEDMNVAIGYQTMNLVNNDSADHNIALGYQALQTTQTAGSVAIGNQALKALTSGARNTAIGYQSALNNATGLDGTFLGYQSGLNVLLNHNTGIGSKTLQKLGTTGGGGAGENNTAIGTFAMAGGDDTVANNTAKNNVAVGYASLGGATKGSDGSAFTTHSSTAVGYEALTNLAGGNSNLAIGYQSSKELTAGAANITLGHQAMLNATAISSAIFIGAHAGDAITTSTNPNGTIGIGYDALTALTSGSANTAIGYESAKALTTGGANVSIGYQAMSIGTVVSNSVAIGRSAGKNIATDGNAQRNTYVGAYAGETVTNGLGHTFVGYYAGQAYDSGNFNSDVTYIGVSAGQNHTGGGNNTAIGAYAHHGKSSTTGGSGNTVIGSRSAYYVNDIDKTVLIGAYTVGANEATSAIDGTVAIGYSALNALTSGQKNTAVGYLSADSLQTGSMNTLLGWNVDLSANDSESQIVIGNQFAGTANTRVHIGNASSHIYNDYNSNATWTHSSDERQKKEIKDDTLGLEFINDIRPVTYKHKSPSEFPKEWDAYNADDKESMGGDKVIHGLIAQEVKQALDKQGIDTFSGWDENPDGRQNVSFEAFVLPLIKSVQELSAEIDKLKKQLKDK